MLYLYAFSAQPTTLPAVAGIAGSALTLEHFDGIDAVVSEVNDGEVERSEESVLAHARVVEELATVNDAVVPARFGGGFAHRESLRDRILEREANLRGALERVRGCVELGVRVLAPEEEAVTAASGLDYMLSRLERVRRDEQAAEDLHRPLAAIAKDSTTRLRATPQLFLSAAYLVRRDEIGRFRDAVRAQQEEHPRLSFACTGPWPPYSFATVEADEA